MAQTIETQPLPYDIFGEGPWQITWVWTTGYRGKDRVPTAEKAATFVEELFKRTQPPEYDIARLQVINTETGERLPSLPPTTPARSRPVPDAITAKTCGTCDGDGEITIIQTGAKKKCTRCGGTGTEPDGTESDD